MGKGDFVKKYLGLILNVLLILGILSCVFLAMYKSSVFTSKKSTDVPQETVPATEDTVVPTEEFVVGVIQHSDIDNCNNVYQGFSSRMAVHCYNNGYNIKIDHVLETDNEKSKDVIQNFIDNEYDLIVTIGPFASKLAASMTTDIPVIFAAVSEPEQVGIVKTNEVPGGNVTGVSDYIPCFEQICSIKELFPDCKQIGAIYKGDDHDATTQVLMGKKEAQRAEINIPYNEYAVSDEEDIEEALSQMLDDGVEVIYTPVDSFINKNLEAIVGFSNEHKIPVVCGNLDMLSKGCFSTSVTNYLAIGHSTADMVLDVLINKVDTATQPVLYRYECDLHINQEAIVNLGVYIPDALKATAIIE